MKVLGDTWLIWDLIVTSGRPPTPFDAGRWVQQLLLRYSQNLAESGSEESLTMQNKPIGTERVPKGHQSQPRGDQNISTNEDPQKGERHTRERGGGDWDCWSVFGTTWSIKGLNFGAHWISESRSAGRFALPKKRKTTNIWYQIYR